VKKSLATAIERVRRSTSGADLVNGPSPIVECAVGWQGLRVLGGRLAQGDTLTFDQPDPDGAVRRATIQALGRVGTPPAVDLVLDLLDGCAPISAAERLRALHALAGVSDPASVPSVLAALARTEGRARRRALVAPLARTANPLAPSVLLEAVETDPDVETRCTAMQGLGLVGDPRALPALRERERRGDEVERSYARTAMERIARR